ncbi:hypothetical protein HanRHA438_Chr11g0522871 [Helianthus annuus]|nr:hypothetical protein HanRHA438_Chr11g0522871 [Helianthus annuus]
MVSIGNPNYSLLRNLVIPDTHVSVGGVWGAKKPKSKGFSIGDQNIPIFNRSSECDGVDTSAKIKTQKE